MALLGTARSGIVFAMWLAEFAEMKKKLAWEFMEVDHLVNKRSLHIIIHRWGDTWLEGLWNEGMDLYSPHHQWHFASLSTKLKIEAKPENWLIWDEIMFKNHVFIRNLRPLKGDSNILTAGKFLALICTGTCFYLIRDYIHVVSLLFVSKLPFVP